MVTACHRRFWNFIGSTTGKVVQSWASEEDLRMFLLHKIPKLKIQDDPFKRILAISTDSKRFSVLFTYRSVVAGRDGLAIKQYINI